MIDLSSTSLAIIKNDNNYFTNNLFFISQGILSSLYLLVICHSQFPTVEGLFFKIILVFEYSFLLQNEICSYRLYIMLSSAPYPLVHFDCTTLVLLKIIMQSVIRDHES